MVKTIAAFTIPYYQYLDTEGHPTSTLPRCAQNIDHLKKLYEMMTLTRVFDAKAIALQRTGKLGTYASSLGQEAVSIGIGYALSPEDVFCPAYRNHGTQLLRGVSMAEILAFWGGSERGNAFVAETAQQDLPNCIPIGSQCLHAAGIAIAMKLREQPRATLVTCGDGATSQGDFYESMNIAGVWQLPLVIVIENNQWAISVPRSAQTATQTLAQKAIAAGIPAEQVDGNDVIAVQERITKALEKARQGDGATVIEALTYRLSDHTTADDASRYRSSTEVSEAWKNEPILRLRRYLAQKGAWSDNEEKKLQASFREIVEANVKAYEALPQESSEHIFDYHYGSLPKNLQKQRAAFLENL